MKKTFLPFFSILILGISVSAMPAQAGILEFFFPSLRDTGPDPAETGIAPFALPSEEEAAAAGEGGEQTPLSATQLDKTESSVPMHLPHRSSAKIGEWVITAVSEAMTFDDVNYRDDLGQTEGYFAPEGRAQYTAFLEDKKILKVLDSGKYQIRSYVENAPLLLNEGAVQKRFRWLYQVPVMVSYMKNGVRDYKNVEPVNQKIVLTVQIGRVSGSSDPEGLAIERWSGKVEEIGKK